MVGEIGPVEDAALLRPENGPPLVFTVDFITVSVYLERAMMPWVNAVKRLGIDCRIRTIEVSQYMNRLGTYDFDMTIVTYPQTLTPGIELPVEIRLRMLHFAAEYFVFVTIRDQLE